MKIASGPAARRPCFGVLELELELILEEWDPIGVYRPDALPVDPAHRTAQQHEYDDLVRPIIAHLMDSDDQPAFTSALRAVLAADYGLEFEDVEADADLRSFAASVVGWWGSGANFIYADILPDELHRIERAADLARTFGAQRLVVGGGARRAAGTTDEDYRRLGESLDRVVRIAEERGLEASYHPHLSTIVESPTELERLLQLSSIAFCPDTAHLAAGGGDPAALIRQHAGRVRHVHLKDYRADPFAFLPLGEGDLDFPDIIAALREIGYDSWLMVELDAYEGAPGDAARISKAYLDRLLSA